MNTSDILTIINVVIVGAGVPTGVKIVNNMIKENKKIKRAEKFKKWQENRRAEK